MTSLIPKHCFPRFHLKNSSYKMQAVLYPPHSTVFQAPVKLLFIPFQLPLTEACSAPGIICLNPLNSFALGTTIIFIYREKGDPNNLVICQLLQI